MVLPFTLKRSSMANFLVGQVKLDFQRVPPVGEKPDIIRTVTHVKLLSPVFFPELTGMSSILLRQNVHCYCSYHLEKMFLTFLFEGLIPAQEELNFVYVRPFKIFFLGQFVLCWHAMSCV